MKDRVRSDMRGLALHQPWAAAVALGYKKIETRSWPSPYFGPVAIHATKRWTHVERNAARRLGLAVGGEPFVTNRHGKRPVNFRGGVVAIAEIVSSEEMSPELIAKQTGLELMFGDWREGRFAWRLENVRPLTSAYPMTGRQGLWWLSQAEAEAVRLLAGVKP